MTDTYPALVVERDADTVSARIRDLPQQRPGAGQVRVDVEFSSINFKDGLAVTGKPGVIRDYPLTAGIDLVGTVAESADERFAEGERVLVNGWGIGERHAGGLARQAIVQGDWITRVPDGLENWHAAAIGTAGYTAALSVLAIEESAPEGSALPSGEILVTGAVGGVGSIAVMLASRGPDASGRPVIASTGRPEQEAYLRRLGARGIIDRAELGRESKALETERWAAAIDSVGGTTLATVLAQTRYGGTVTACGLAESAALPATVMPFILRGIRLQGINSVLAPAELRERAWALLAERLPLELLEEASETVALSEAVAVAEEILAGRVRGRTVVDVRSR